MKKITTHTPKSAALIYRILWPIWAGALLLAYLANDQLIFWVLGFAVGISGLLYTLNTYRYLRTKAARFPNQAKTQGFIFGILLIVPAVGLWLSRDTLNGWPWLVPAIGLLIGICYTSPRLSQTK